MKPRYERSIDHGVRRTTLCPFLWTLLPISSVQMGPVKYLCPDSIAWGEAKWISTGGCHAVRRRCAHGSPPRADRIRESLMRLLPIVLQRRDLKPRSHVLLCMQDAVRNTRDMYTRYQLAVKLRQGREEAVEGRARAD
jgi:hypothetical protein